MYIGTKGISVTQTRSVTRRKSVRRWMSLPECYAVRWDGVGWYVCGQFEMAA
jgi:hypothetical protein